MSNSTTPLKRCNKCGQEFPATPEYFYRNHMMPDGMQYKCKICQRAYDREYKHKPEVKERLRIQNTNHAREKRKDPAFRKRIAENTRRYYRKHRGNPEFKKLISDYNRKHRNDPHYREAILQGKRDYYEKNKNNPGHIARFRIAIHRRRARKLSLPNTFTGQHWLLCLGYWHNCCAVCGNQLRGLFDIEPNADHWIALNDKRPDNPGTTPDNMICLCNRCNFNKHDKDPGQWLNQRYNKRKATEILSRIHDYFDWIKQQ